MTAPHITAQLTMDGLEALRNAAIVAILGGAVLGFGFLWWIKTNNLRWTWLLTLAPLPWLLWLINKPLAALVLIALGLSTWRAAKDHYEMLEAGGDLAQVANRRRGILDVSRAHEAQRKVKRNGYLDEHGLVLGNDEHRQPVRVPVGRRSGRHTLVVGATGSGKTVTQAWIAQRLILEGHACIAIDPKGDPLLAHTLRAAAEASGRRFVHWHPTGDLVYNPFAHGTTTELVDKLLAGEQWSEPHYLRQAQRYLGHALRGLAAAGESVDLLTIVRMADPERLELLARSLREPDRRALTDYLDDLGPEQRRGLSGMRDRLAVLAESDMAGVLIPRGEPTVAIDLDWAINDRAVVLFTLDADRRPLASQMVAAAITQDLITLAAARQLDPQPTLVVIDEFAALAAGQVTRLFGRGRSAGLSLLLGTQELADLTNVDPALRDQVTGNIELLIAHRQNVPDSADLIARIAGTQGTWVHTERTGPVTAGQPRGAGTRTRGWEYVIHPDQLKRLRPGTAAVIAPAQERATITRIHHPSVAS